MHTTDDLSSFAARTAPGDLLLFDQLHPMGALIQLTDMLPVNHVALVGEAGASVTMIHAGPPPAGPGDPRGGVHVSEGSLAAYVRRQEIMVRRDFEVGAVRTLHLLRHTSLAADPDRAVAVVTAARALRDDPEVSFDTDYWVPLALPTIHRALVETGILEQLMDRVGEGGRTRRALAMATLQLLAGAATAARERVRDLPDDARLLSCSEFVARCYLRAGLELTVVAPVRRPLVAHGELSDEAAEVTEALAELAAEDEARRLPPEDGGSRRALGEGTTPGPESVTPGDLLISPSFETVAVLVQPLTKIG